MIIEKTNGQLWRLASIVLICGIPLSLISSTISNLMDSTQAFQQAERERTVTSGIVAQLEKHRALAIKPVDTASLYLTSSSDTLARAEIQDRANRLVAQAGGQLAEVQLIGSPEQEAQGTLAIQLTLKIDNKGMLDLLYAIESGVPLLDVTSLNVQPSDDQNETDRRTDGALLVNLTIEGHWRKNSE